MRDLQHDSDEDVKGLFIGMTISLLIFLAAIIALIIQVNP